LLQGRYSFYSFARARQVPTQKLSGVAVDHQRQGDPTIPARSDAAEILGASRTRRDGYRRQRLHYGLKDLAA
jgi:hypothetical protein